ncbi:MAG: UDP-N-acetylmuramate dehydrogenase [gamma proteobacterium symbiont of Bathyaustriella thionipta]|nr:UDP-N-acetylmuramate dehydrogenase [gamma proteobacterium symbiont of Bathyaustriella thionipta]
MTAASQPMRLRGEISYDEPLSKHTSWRVGGAARCFYRPADAQDLSVFLAALPQDEPLLWLGLGSNLLVRDGGFKGTVIALQGRLADIHIQNDGGLLAGAGVSCAKLARTAVRNEWVGLEFFAGIPGTLGGALRMNAGAFGGETWQQVKWVQTIDRQGVLRQRQASEFKVAYRQVDGPLNEWFTAAQFQLHKGDTQQAQSRIRDLLKRRSQSQPTRLPSCGSVFRNPEGEHAARLIEAAGLKDYCIGKACVSSQHANFIINTGGASASDIEALIAHIQAVVRDRFAIEMQPEVHRVGEAQ